VVTPVTDLGGFAGKKVSRNSLRGLEALNFFMADVQGGLGPYLTVFLAGEHWQPGSIGLAMAATSISSAVCQIPAGMLVDATRAKRLIAAASGLMIAAACLVIAWFPHFFPVTGAQVAIGAAAALVPPTLAALALGLAGRKRFDATISRTQSFNHAGNFAAAALAGTLGHFIGIIWIFYLICAFAGASALSAMLIDPREIDHMLARGGETTRARSSEVESTSDGNRPLRQPARSSEVESTSDGNRPLRQPARSSEVESTSDGNRPVGGREPSRSEAASGRLEPLAIRDLLKRRDLLVFLGSVTLFHFGNAAMLPMAGQMLARSHPGQATLALSACIIVAQLVMAGVAWAVGLAATRGIGRKPVFLIAYALLPVRGVLFTFTASGYGTTSGYGVVGIQLLDGVAAGIFGVVAILIASDLMRGTGRFNLAQGLVALCVGIGAGLSNVVGEYAVQWFGYSMGFLSLAGIAVVALLFFALLMPETRSDLRTAGESV
jgi:MFS family permease